MAEHWLGSLRIDEISLVDQPSNPGALVALKKRDGDKPVGGPSASELALPQYRENTDPKFSVWSKQKRSKMKYRDVRSLVNKNEAPPDSYLAVWSAVFEKADEGGGSRMEREARAGKLLEQDFREGGHMVEYLSKFDKRMSRDGFEAEALAKRDRDSLGSPGLDQAVVKIMKANPGLNKHEAVRKLLTSEEGERLYGEYEERRRIAKLDQSRDYPGNDADDDDDDAKEKRKRRARMKCKSSDDTMDDAADRDGDDDGEDEGDDDDTEKLRRKGLKIAKRLGLVMVTSESIRKQAPSKLCQSCGTGNTLSSVMCHDCGARF